MQRPQNCLSYRFGTLARYNTEQERFAKTTLQNILRSKMGISNENNQANRAISTGKLRTLLHFHTQPINVVVFHGSQGILVFGLVSRLDAFSGYLFRI